ncbi:hypothetical protein XENTR_v10022594 [Xenopus tropicalis]|nr:hypothetical protein XENTR_v10022594 [Xenopus tropicalis]
MALTLSLMANSCCASSTCHGKWSSSPTAQDLYKSRGCIWPQGNYLDKHGTAGTIQRIKWGPPSRTTGRQFLHWTPCCSQNGDTGQAQHMMAHFRTATENHLLQSELSLGWREGEG